MASRNADVNLVIRARNDADRAINSVADSLEALFGDAKDANGGLGDLGRTLASLDKAFAAINSKADAAGSAFQRQQSAISESRQQLAAVEGQAESAARALEKLRAAVVDEVLAGRDHSPLLRQIEQVEQAQAGLGARAATLSRTIDAQAGALDRSESSLLKLGATLHAVEDGQAEAAARIELTNQALREQAEVAERVTDIQRRINDLTGVSRPDATGSAARAAETLAAADAEFRLAEARRAANSSLAERATLESALERTTGAGRVRATDAGATFSALAEREKQAEEGERAAKAERDLAAAENATNSALAERAQIEAALERNTGIGRGRAADNGATISALTELIDKEHQAALGLAQMDLEAEQLRAALDPLAAIQDRYNGALARFRELATAGKIGADEFAEAEQHLAAQASRAREALERGEHVGKTGLFGLALR